MGKFYEIENDNSDEKIVFKVLDEETNNFDNPVVYNNLSTPITLTYLNKNIKTNFQINKNDSSVIYDGRLLRTANVDLTRLYCKVNLQINIETIDGEKYRTKLYIDIPYKTNEYSIYNGNILTKVQTNGNAKFYNF